MHIAWVQERQDRAMPSLEAVAKDGFYLLGYEVRGFTRDDLDEGRVELNEDTIVAGYIGTVLVALDRLGVERPQNIDYPDALKPWMFRHIERTTVGDFLKFWSERMATKTTDMDREFGMAQPSKFIKPIHDHKQFTGKIIEAGDSSMLGMLAQLPKDFEIWVSDPVQFVSEYRFFCRRHEVVGVGHYKGDPTKFPSTRDVQAMATAWNEAPAAWCMDLGVVQQDFSNGMKAFQTTLVEVNDGHSMGDYGLYPALYARLLEARWCELTGFDPISPW
jgi:hypothetical protein